MRLNLTAGTTSSTPTASRITGVIVGARADEEGSRSKERYFSPRDKNSDWDVGDQPPEFWNQFKTDFAPGTHVRIHPLLDWTELNIWEYIKRENDPDQCRSTTTRATGKRYRSLGCEPLPGADRVAPRRTSTRSSSSSERQAQEHRRARRPRCRTRQDTYAMEKLRREGYM